MKTLTTLFLSLFLLAGIVTAQEIEIYHPDFTYDVDRGFTKQHVTVDASIDAQVWKRVGAVPDSSMLGYAASVDQRTLSTQAYTSGSPTEFFATNTYAVIDAVNLLPYAAYDCQVVFFTKAQYQKGDNGAQFNVLLSTDYSGDPEMATWDVMNSQLDTIDCSNPYDGNWAKSTLDLNAYKSASSLTLAFQYLVETGGDIESELDSNDEDSITVRPGNWKVSEVKFTATEPENIENVFQCRFNDFNKFSFVGVTSTDGQMWGTKSALNPELATDSTAKSVSVSAVYTDGDLKNVSATEAWMVLQTLDCTNYSDMVLSFYNKSQYKKDSSDSKLQVMLSTDYVAVEGDSVRAVNAATWSDITAGFVLDESIGYDSDWAKSEGMISAAGDSMVTIAFKYTCTDTQTDVNGANVDERAGTWFLSDVAINAVDSESDGGDPAGTEVVKVVELNVYPNPTTGILYFAKEVSAVQVYSLDGQLLINTNAVSSTVDMSALNSGMYFVRCNIGGDYAVSRVLKK